jgi:hypothetical protein
MNGIVKEVFEKTSVPVVIVFPNAVYTSCGV